MNLTWPVSLDQLWNSPASPMWLTLAAAAFFGIIVLITLVRAERSVANGALTVITLLAVGIAMTSTMREFDAARHAVTTNARTEAQPAIALPALSCIDDLAGDLVLSNCEKTLFGSADSTAAAVNYAAAMITRLTAAGDVATADKAMKPELMALRRAVERDRYGLMAYVLLTRDRCTPSDCAVFRSVTDHQQLASNMEARTYEGLVTRYASQWNAPPAQGQVQPAAGLLAGLAPNVPTGKPTNAEFPSAASTPPVSIMTPEPTSSTSRAASAAAASTPAVRPPPSAAAASHAQTSNQASNQASKKTAAPKPKPPATAPAAPQAAEAPPASEQ
jgi:hypothetical protein